MSTSHTSLQFDERHGQLRRIVENISQVIVGKESVIELLMVAILADGHCLIEDVPGVGKTLLVRAAAASLGCSFKRIQFTPDLLPSDVTGVSIFNQKTQEFEFRPGPVFGQVVLADEINRTTPKTQSALLEALDEHQVTADGTVYPLPSPFIVLATENPIELEGTFPLPEAQLDRFMFRLSMGYPSFDDEVAILDRQRATHGTNSLLEGIRAVASAEDVLHWREQCARVYVDPRVKQYIVRIVQATREHRDVYLGASPRASVALYRAAQACAYLRGRLYVIPDDVRELAEPTLAHRVLATPEYNLSGGQVNTLIRDITAAVPIPAVQSVGQGAGH